MSNILVVVDMQNDFINGPLQTNEARDIIPSLVKRIREFDGYVIFTRDTHDADYMSSEEGRHLPVIHCQHGSDGWKLHPEIEKACQAVNGTIIDKHTFGSQELIEHLKKIDKTDPIKSVEFIGICTDICVISNVMLTKTFFPNIPISVRQECCAGVTPKSHQTALDAMKMCHINIL